MKYLPKMKLSTEEASRRLIQLEKVKDITRDTNQNFAELFMHGLVLLENKNIEEARRIFKKLLAISVEYGWETDALLLNLEMDHLDEINGFALEKIKGDFLEFLKKNNLQIMKF